MKFYYSLQTSDYYPTTLTAFLQREIMSFPGAIWQLQYIWNKCRPFITGFKRFTHRHKYRTLTRLLLQ